VTDEKPRLTEPAAAAKILEQKLKEPTRARTIADAAAESGLPLRDAESGLTFLTSEYRGHLRVTDDGDLLYLFPTGFTKPWETREQWERAVTAVGHALASAGRFIVRAWLLIAMVGYALLFLAMIIGLSTAGGRRDDDRGPGLSMLGGLFRMIADAMFWTFRPFTPLYVMDPYLYDGGAYAGAPARFGEQRRRARQEPEVPFYERVNRFVFGPREAPKDPLAERARIVEEIRARKGRIGVADVMRVTGLSRDEADPLMARLMLDYDGDVDVGEQGGIVYRFPNIRKTAGLQLVVPPPNIRVGSAAWDTKKVAPPLTGNPGGSNVAIAALNGFNLLASAWVLANGMTIHNLFLSMQKHHPRILPDDGTPIVLGVIPLLFSILIFALPLFRAIGRRFTVARAAKENARLAIMKEVLTHAPKKELVADETLKKVYRVATGEEPSSKEITRQVVALGGDVDTGPNGEVRYRFADLEAEAEAVEDERAHAHESEARAGKVIFASDA
jgi:hypothetical protein